MPDQTAALIADARAWYDSELSPESESLITRLADALSAAHTVIQEAKAIAEAIMFDQDAGPAREALLAILSKYQSGEEDGR